jgi:hypothetical protein
MRELSLNERSSSFKEPAFLKTTRYLRSTLVCAGFVSFVWTTDDAEDSGLRALCL